MISDERAAEVLAGVQKAAVQITEPGGPLDAVRQMMMIGVIIALGDEAVPVWVINVQCGRADRLFKEGGV